MLNFIIKLKNKPNGPIYFYYKKHIFTLLNILKDKGYINYNIIKEPNGNLYKLNIIENKLKSIYILKNKKPISYKNINTGFYSYILSTPKGLLFHEDAIKFKVGGFILCKFI